MNCFLSDPCQHFCFCPPLIWIQNAIMKIYFLLFSCLLWFFEASAQPFHPVSNLQYDRKSQARSTSASSLLLIGGIGLIAAGVISYAAESDNSYYPGKAVGTGLMIGGGAALIAGVALRRADRKSSSAKAVGLKMEQIACLHNTKTGFNFRNLSFPAVALQIQFKASKNKLYGSP